MEGTMASLPNRFKIHLAVVLAVCLGFAFTPLPGYSANVAVYAEGAYTATNLDLYIYADIDTSDPILSFGVKVNHPPEWTVEAASKNENDWYFGEPEPGTKYPYMVPDSSSPGSVIIIGGKLDTNAPTQGVSGSRVLLGKVTFDHDGATNFDGVVDLTYAHGLGAPTDSFKNFVGTDGTVKDGEGMSFAVEIHERGDANGDGRFDVNDFLALKTFSGSSVFPCWADCNGDERIDVNDFLCLKTK
jgi:hypothetical protein